AGGQQVVNVDVLELDLAEFHTADLGCGATKQPARFGTAHSCCFAEFAQSHAEDHPAGCGADVAVVLVIVRGGGHEGTFRESGLLGGPVRRHLRKRTLQQVAHAGSKQSPIVSDSGPCSVDVDHK